MSINKIAITGFDILTSLGNTNQTWSGLLNGKKAVNFDKNYGFFIGEISNRSYNYKNYEKKYHHIDPINSMILSSTSNAIKMSCLDKYYNDYEIGVIIGSMQFTEYSKEKIVLDYSMRKKRPFPRLGIQQLNNSTSAQVAIENKFKGPNLTVSTACSSGGQAISIACDQIRLNKAKAFVVSGVDMLLPNNGLSKVYDSLHVFSRKKFYGPFSKLRNGMAMGEGIGSVFLEDYSSAVKRGAKIYGTILSTVSTCDANNMAHPDMSGQTLEHTMTKLISDVINVKDIGAIIAHATATKVGDKSEAHAIKMFEKKYNIPVTSIKGNIGHTFGASGVIQIVIALKILQNMLIPRTWLGANLENNIGINVVKKNIQCKKKFIISNSFGVGGNNVSILVGK